MSCNTLEKDSNYWIVAGFGAGHDRANSFMGCARSIPGWSAYYWIAPSNKAVQTGLVSVHDSFTTTRYTF
jgi:hypothetical protein